MTLHDLFYIIESPDRNIEILHDSITLQMLPGINIGVQYIKYTSEYIPKLQLHQQTMGRGVGANLKPTKVIEVALVVDKIESGSEDFIESDSIDIMDFCTFVIKILEYL